MNPQAATRGLFGVNDMVTEADVRTRLTLSPAEDEVISASLSVARGITGMGNDEILSLAASPRRALSKDSRPHVESRFVTAHPPLTIYQTLSQYGAPQMDLVLDTPVRKSVAVEVWQGTVSIYRQETSFSLDATQSVRFEQRLDLLPGDYRLLFTVDGTVHPYPLHVSAPEAVSELLIGEPGEAGRAGSPCGFGGMRVDPSARGNLALLQNVKGSGVEWRLRRGTAVVWNRKVADEQFASLNLNEIKAPAGEYMLEASSEAVKRAQPVWLGGKPATANTVISNNVNLMPGERLRLLARQHLIRGSIDQAKILLSQAKAAGGGWSVDVDLGRIDALQGRYDEARARLVPVLRAEPRNVEAVVALAFVEAELQDYTMAAKLYRQALDIQPSAAIAQALARVAGR